MNIGDRIGDYEIIQVIGAGGMGQVYKVRNTLSERIEAMKVALSNLEGSQEALARFQREIKVQAALDHPNIAKLHTAMRHGNQILMFMEFVEGESLSKMVEAGPLPVTSVIGYAGQALDALGYAHSQGVVHRDIKPANIMVTTNGIVKLMDFGIARAKADRKLTQTGSAVGSLYYMSPEQIRGGDPDPRSDLYSFGITLYELVTGRRPFKGDSDFQIMSAHLQESPAPPIDVVAGVPGELSDIILMAIAKDPEARFQSAQAFRAALTSVNAAAAPGIAAPTPKPASTLPPTKTVAGSQDATVAMATGPRIPKPSAPPLPVPPMQTAPPIQTAPQPPPMAPPPVQVAAPASRRGLYMALGSVATLAVLVAAVIEGPKLFKSGSTDAQTQSLPAPSGAPAAVPSSAASPVTAAPQSTQPSQASPASAVPATPPPRVSAPQAAPLTASPTTARQVIPAPAPVARPVVQPAAQPAPQQQPIPQPAPQPAAQAPPTAPVQQAPVQARPAAPSPELNELRESYNLVSVRASTAKAGLSAMQQQMSRQGLNLRGDVREAQTRMDYMLQESTASIRAGDVEGGKRNLQMAERALESIEKFLGR